MANQIERDVYVTYDALKNPISYVRGTNALPIILHFRDYEIPEGASAAVAVIKPSGNGVYNPASISGNDVTIAVDPQMFIELGMCELQVSISHADKELVTFAQPVCVKPNYKEGDFPPSETSSEFIDKIIADAQTAVDNANKAILEMDTNFPKLVNTDEIDTLETESKTVAGAINELLAEKAPGIVCTTTGEQISIDNASDLKFRGLKVYGKGEQVKTNGYQLFDASKLLGKIVSGASLINNDDGSFTFYANGSSTADISQDYILSHEEFVKLFKVGNVYLKGAFNNVVYFELQVLSSAGNLYLRNDVVKNITEEIYSDATGIFYFRIPIGANVAQTTVKPIVYQDGDGTWEPFSNGVPSPSPEYQHPIHKPGESGSMNVNVTGAQLFDASKVPTKTQSGATVTNNDDGSFTISGSGNLIGDFDSRYSISHDDFVKMFKSGTLHLKCDHVTEPYFTVTFYRNNSQNYLNFDNSAKTDNSIIITDEFINDPTSYVKYGFYGILGHTIKNYTIKPMLYQDGDGTWEPFKQPQTLPITTPNGLPGIPVTSGGNYTDQNGQQWISDVKDYETGKYTQMVQEVVYDGSSDEPWDFSSIGWGRARFDIYCYGVKYGGKCISNMASYNFTTEEFNVIFISGANPWISIVLALDKFPTLQSFKDFLASNNLKVIYELSEPIVTDIPAEEMAEYNAMHSNYPNTNVFSDQTVEPGMEVKYTADTKMYVDGKFQDLQDSITTMIADAQSQFVTNANMSSISQLGTTDKTLVGAINELNNK